MSYIYHIFSKTNDKSGVYIGQTTQAGYIRPVDHFRSGYRGRGENVLFQNFLKEHSFDEMEVEIFSAPNYGLDPVELDNFLKEWYQSYQVYYDTKINDDGGTIDPQRKQKFDEALRLNAAEILHTYYYEKHNIYGQVCALSMGGQQNASFSKEGIVLHRNLNPATVVALLESTGQTRQSLGDLQQIFNTYFQKYANKEGLYASLLRDWIANKGTNIHSIVRNFFTANLERIIRNMQDDLEKGHTQYGYRISWPKGHAINFMNGSASLNSLVDMVTNHFKYHKARLERDCKNKSIQESADLIMRFIAQAFTNLSISSFIKIKPKRNFIRQSVCSGIGTADEITPLIIVDHLKRISYDYFRRLADRAKRQIENIYMMGFNNHSIFRRTLSKEEQKIQLLNLPLMINLIREEYMQEGIRASFITNYEHWLNFAHGMLTVYTKNNGSIFNAKMSMEEVEDYPLGILDMEIEADNTINIASPAYEFSPATYAYIEQHQNMSRLDLQYY